MSGFDFKTPCNKPRRRQDKQEPRSDEEPLHQTSAPAPAATSNIHRIHRQRDTLLLKNKLIDINVDNMIDINVARQWLEGLTPEIKNKIGDSYSVLLNQLNADSVQLNADSADEDEEWEEMDDSGNYEFPC